MASFWVVQGFIFDLFWVSGRGLPAKCVLGAGSWSRLGAVLGPKIGGPSNPQVPPKPNPIAVLGRLEGSLERPGPGAFWERLGAF